MKHRYGLPLFSFYDHTGMTCHCEKMARRGWLLDKMGGILWRYHSIEPQRLRFAMTYFPEVTGFEPDTPAAQTDMQALCAQAGWQLAANAGKFQVYYNEDPEAVELDTDPGIQLEVIHRAMKKNFLPSYVMLAVCAILQILTQIGSLTRDYGVFYSGPAQYFSGFSWMMLPTWCALLAIYLLELGRYLLWYRKAKRRAEDGLMTPSPNSGWIQGLAVVLLFIILLSWGLSSNMRDVVFAMLAMLLGVGVLSVLLSKILKKWKVSAKINMLVTCGASVILSLLLVSGGITKGILTREREENIETYEYEGHTFTRYTDDIPLRLEDVGYPAAEDSTSLNEQRSPLATQRVAFQRPQMDNLSREELRYVIAEVKLGLLWQPCLDYYLKEAGDPAESDAAAWGS
ncbi:MAG: DUF2812 domain-containing protein, partial [Clostridia bacterium]|nr:DUF2812 domain-containing protein [Clostridia bacterium]